MLCLAFPLLAPRRSASASFQTRLPELDAVEVATLVVQGARDQFGIPPAGPCRSVVQVQVITACERIPRRSLAQCARGFPECSTG